MRHVISLVKRRITDTTVGLFQHGPIPLEHTERYHGDPGLCGPGSVSWRVLGDVTSMVGGVRALLMQTAHPEVVAGVGDHSNYRDDTLGRLSRTSFYVTETTFGAMPEVEAAVRMVRRAHRPVHGTSERGRPYDANTPAYAAWVHNVLTDSFLVAYQTYGPGRLTTDEADRFVAEQTAVGRLLDADPLPTTAADLTDWIAGHPDLAATEHQSDAVEFLLDPPLQPAVKLGYRTLTAAAVDTIAAPLRRQLRVRVNRGALQAGKALIPTLRWSLGASPVWKAALERCDAPLPTDVHFRDR